MKNGKIISFTLALVFIVFSLTACVGKDTDDTSGSSVNTGETVWTETGNTAQTVNETDTLQRSTTVDGETEKPLSEEPQTAVDPFELLSSAIGMSRISTAKYDLTATDVKFSTSNSALTKLIADYIDSETVSKQNSKGTAIEKPAFAAIKKDDCLSYNVTDFGGEYRLTFKLKKLSLPSSSSAPKAGYQFFLDSKAVETTLHRANDKINFLNVGKIELFDGVINVAVSNDSGKIISASLTFSETYMDKVDLSGLEIPKILSGIEISAELKYKLSAVYTF